MTSLALFGIFAGLKPVTYAPLRLSPLEGMPNPIRVGDRFGRLEIKRLSDRTDAKGNRYFWYCACDCGGRVDVHANQLRAGNAVSCGARCSIPKRQRDRIPRGRPK